MIKTTKEKEVKTVKYIDLFCGLGAFHKAFSLSETSNLKYKCVFACDIDDMVRKLYKENYKVTPTGDITVGKINKHLKNIDQSEIIWQIT